MSALIEHMRQLFARATQGEWVLSYDRHKNPIIVDKQGRVIVDGDAYADDIMLIVEMYRRVPEMMALIENAGSAMENALIGFEQEANNFAASVARLTAAHKVQIAERDMRLAELHAKLDRLEAQEPQNTIMREEREAMVPVVAAAKQYVRFRFFEPLREAMARFNAWEKGRN